MSDPLVGTLINGKFRVIEAIGQGGMGSVYRAEQLPLGRIVAVKVLRTKAGVSDVDPAFQRRFFLEASLCAKLSHANVVTIYDSGETDDGLPYIVMELLDGESLRELLTRGPLPLETVAALGLQMARGLARAHDLGVVHRDLKPENIFIVKTESGEPLLKLVDFGIARSRGDTRLTLAGE
ncbi:MAG: serine/threonine-protein kinase, partial [Deltaproteobacteria bacterium]